MNFQCHTGHQFLSYPTKQLLTRMLGPLCGLDHEIGFLLPGSQDASIVVTGAELTGVHRLLNLPAPGKGAYHLGGCGIHLNEAVIRTLGETVERYSQMMSELSGLAECKFASYQEMITLDNHVLSPDKFNYFLSQQYHQKNFPFDAYIHDQPLTWVKLDSLLRRSYLWVPAQLVFVGYKVKREKQEPWLASAVTTGTAAHTDRHQALINAIMELIQIDSAMGHWYSRSQAPRILFDKRTASLANLLSKFCKNNFTNYTFHWLKNIDLPGFSVACVYRGSSNSIPSITVGLGSSIQLIDAMYKAFLEAVGIVGLARMIIFDKSYHLKTNSIDPKTIYDLDTNVAYYGLSNQNDFITTKYSLSNTIYASELPNDLINNSPEIVAILLDAFSKNHKELLFCNLTGVEAQDLGFVVPRVWSPDLLPLSLPSVPFLNHSRYLAYGSAQHDNPHPYP